MNQNRTYLFSALSLVLVALTGCNENSDSKDKQNDYLPSSWSAAEVVSLCDNPDAQRVPYDAIMECQGKTYYNKKIERSPHEIVVSFDFISDCCLEFDIWYVIENDVLTIRYKPTDSLPCDCKCDYRGMVNIADERIDFDKLHRVKIKRGK